MVWRAVLLALVVGLGVSGHADAAANPSVVLVNGLEYCSGFFTGPTTLVTAKHCAPTRAGMAVQVSQPDGTLAPCVATVNYVASEDWTLLAGCRSPVWLTLRTDALHPGDRLAFVGYSILLAGQRQATSAGTVYAYDPSSSVFTANASGVGAGYSGSPVMDADGKVVGVVSYRTPPGSPYDVGMTKAVAKMGQLNSWRQRLPVSFLRAPGDFRCHTGFAYC